MPRRRQKFTGSLLKKIDPDEALALGLRAAFALPPSEEDIAAHIQREERARWIALDKHFALDTPLPDFIFQTVYPTQEVPCAACP